MSVYLAYDGSVNGDWIARYAIRLAARTPERKLWVLYCEDVSIPTPALADKFHTLTAEAEAQGVEAVCEVIPAPGGVFRGLLARVPEDPRTRLVCGLRVKAGRRGYLAGTVSEKLLAHEKFHTLAIRVVQPGLLGVARDVLVPVKEGLRGFADGMAFLELLAGDIRRVHVLKVMALRAGAFRRLDASRAGALNAEGLEQAQAVASAIAAETAAEPWQLTSLVRIADNWVKQVVIEAGRLRSDLIYLRAQRTSLRPLFRFGDPMEELLRDTPCDVALYRGPE